MLKTSFERQRLGRWEEGKEERKGGEKTIKKEKDLSSACHLCCKDLCLCPEGTEFRSQPELNPHLSKELPHSDCPPMEDQLNPASYSIP